MRPVPDFRAVPELKKIFVCQCVFESSKTPKQILAGESCATPRNLQNEMSASAGRIISE